MKRLVIPMSMLDEAREFFEERGATGCEGTAMIAASMNVATRLVIPDQVATPVPECRVDVTATGKLSLAVALPPSEQYVARIHSHPGQAFHSPVDDANPAITHTGAISIVVPYFGLGLRHGLHPCAVYVLESDRGWVELRAGPERDETVTVA
jgi:hypothetical protein